MLVKVYAPPVDFFVTFRSARDLNHVVKSSVIVRCGGTLVSFARWGEDHGTKPCAPLFLVKLTLDGLPREAWNLKSLNDLPNNMAVSSCA
jgi:hypothetical protein